MFFLHQYYFISNLCQEISGKSIKSKRSIGINTVHPEGLVANMHTPGSGSLGLVILMIFQIALVIVFAIFTEYDAALQPNAEALEGMEPKKIIPKYPREYELYHIYKYFE